MTPVIFVCTTCHARFRTAVTEEDLKLLGNNPGCPHDDCHGNMERFSIDTWQATDVNIGTLELFAAINGLGFNKERNNCGAKELAKLLIANTIIHVELSEII